MSATVETPKSTSTVNKPLWAAVGVLGAAVVAMGATLIHLETKPDAPSLPLVSATAPAPLGTASGTAASVPAPTALAESSSKTQEQNKTVAPVNHARHATKHIASRNPQAMESSAAGNYPAAWSSPTRCDNCGTVESVTPIQRDGTAGGGGAIAGGVLGAVVGNQVGGGNGKTLATILGAVGGGFAGNTVEKRMRKETVYLVRVHMQDGSTHTVEQTTPASVGAKVMVEGNTLQPAYR